MSNMVVRTNVMALNSHRNLGMTGTQQRNASGRLSSGFRINSAADDAAGLAISEKMRGQIRGLNQASRNASDGISLIQTAEGAMQTINEMVIRIRELVIQAANDTNVHEDGREELSDRVQIQREIDQLLDEIDAVTLRTEFNTRTLLDGSWASDPLRGVDAGVISAFLAVAATQTAITDMNEAREDYATANANLHAGRTNLEMLQRLQAEVESRTPNSVIARVNELAATMDDGSLNAENLTASIANALGTTTAALVAGGDADAFVAAIRSGNLMSTDFADLPAVVTAARTSFITNAASDFLVGWDSGEAGHTVAGAGLPAVPTLTTEASLTAALAAASLRIGTLEGERDTARADMITNVNLANAAVAGHAVIGQEFSTMDELLDAVQAQAEGRTGRALWFQIGANEGQGVRLNIESVDTVALGIDGFRLGGAQQIAIEAGESLGSDGLVTMLDEALAHVTGQRAILGAMQNRLEFTIDNLDTASENLSASESRIRDADMALEMMRLTQANILQQAATAMLAQANQAPQAVLQLLG